MDDIISKISLFYTFGIFPLVRSCVDICLSMFLKGAFVFRHLCSNVVHVEDCPLGLTAISSQTRKINDCHSDKPFSSELDGGISA